MENRNLHELLGSKEFNSKAAREIARNVTSEVCNILQSVEMGLWCDMVTDTSSNGGEVTCNFYYDSDMMVSMEIDAEKINFVLKVKVYNKDSDFTLDRSVNSIRRRYFPRHTVHSAKSNVRELRSEFRIGRKQLNNKDFMAYAAFIIDKAFILGKAMIKANVSDRHVQAA